MSRKSKRGSQKPQIKKSIALIGDGETESWYIQKLKEQEKDILDSMNLTLNSEPKLPSKKKGLKKLCEDIKNLEKEHDKIFWIVDFDTIIRETKEKKNGKERKLDTFRKYFNDLSGKEKITIIINNPCLEFWFLQHFGKISKYYSGYYGELEKELKKHIQNYDKKRKFYNSCNGGKGIYSLLKQKLGKAISNSRDISNSKKLPKLDFNKTDINSYEIGTTEMYKLFDELKINN